MTEPFALIIEDEKALSKIFTTALEAIGFQTEAIFSGREASENLKSRTVIPKLILLDLHLPEVSGSDLLPQIRANEKYKDTRVILVTADSLLGETVRRDADLLLVKPVSVKQIQLLVKRLVGL